MYNRTAFLFGMFTVITVLLLVSLVQGYTYKEYKCFEIGETVEMRHLLGLNLTLSEGTRLAGGGFIHVKEIGNKVVEKELAVLEYNRTIFDTPIANVSLGDEYPEVPCPMEYVGRANEVNLSR